MNFKIISVCILFLTSMGTCFSDDHRLSMESNMKEKMQNSARSIKKVSITEGEFKELIIDQRKIIAISSLRKVGVSQIFPDVSKVITITKASELGKISNANSLVLNEGAAWVSFNNNDVDQIKVLPHSKLERLFGSLKTRSEVMNVFASILNSDPKAYVRNLAFDSRWVNITSLTDEDSLLLKKYDSWEGSFSNSDGYWHLQLEFHNDRLKEIIVQHAPDELP